MAGVDARAQAPTLLTMTDVPVKRPKRPRDEAAEPKPGKRGRYRKRAA